MRHFGVTDHCTTIASKSSVRKTCMTRNGDIPLILRLFGREKEKTLLGVADGATAHTIALMAENGFDCDHMPNSDIVSAVQESRHDGLFKAAEIGAVLGAKVECATRIRCAKQEFLVHSQAAYGGGKAAIASPQTCDGAAIGCVASPGANS